MNIKQLGRNKLFLFALFLVFGAILVWRAPRLLLAPRFWAEEGHVYFKYAWEHSFLQTLFMVYWKAGYFYLSINIASAIAAHILPLEYAPFATTYTALTIQLIPFLIVLFGTSTVFTSPIKKVAACLTFLFLPSITNHAWINVLNSQIWFGLIALLILLEDLERASRGKRWTYRALLAAGALSGVYVVFLTPVFAFRALMERRKERYVQLGIVSVALLFQIGVVIAAASRGVLKETEPLYLGMYLLGDFSFHHIGVALLGYDAALRITKILGGTIGDYLFLILFLAALPITLLNKAKGKPLLKDPRLILVLTLLVLMVAISLTAYRDRTPEAPYAPRYTVLSGFAILFLVLGNIRSSRPVVSCVLTLILFISLFTGVRRYRGYQAFRMDGKYWKGAVAEWRQNPNYVIRIPPLYRWNLRLVPRNGEKTALPQEKRAQIGDTVRIHYRGYRGALRDNDLICSSLRRKPVEFTIGQHMVIPGLESAVVGMREVETKTISIVPEEAFGHRRKDLITTIERSQIPPHIEPKIGMMLRFEANEWRVANVAVTDIMEEPPVTIIAVSEDSITLDYNHPLAGQELTFWIKLVEIERPS